MRLAAVNQIYAIHEAMNGCKRDCFENVNIVPKYERPRSKIEIGVRVTSKIGREVKELFDLTDDMANGPIVF